MLTATPRLSSLPPADIREPMKPALATLMLLVTVTLTGNCGDETTSPASIHGTYVLQTENGQSVPYVISVINSPDGTMTATLEVVGGSFELRSDDSWRYSHSLRETVGGTERTTTTTEIGTYEADGASLQFLRHDGITFTGSVSGTSLRIVIPRPQPAAIVEDILVFAKR